MGHGAHITVRNLELAYESFVVLRNVSFEVQRGAVFVVMGGSGSGKTTLLKSMIGLMEPVEGEVLFGGESLTRAEPAERQRLSQRFGVLFQSGALWSGLTLAENVALPLEELTTLAAAEIRDLVELKLALVGLRGFEGFYPSQLSGGMQKRAGLARAMALDPEILFLDEPSSGLDPVTARHLDELILELSASLGATLVVVTHDLASIFTIATDSIFLDAERKTVTAHGQPRELLERSEDPHLRQFLTRSAGSEARR
jgi:phospholipid/cholesterol/gamma-HCH transport system ATP-binding protein